MSHGTSIPRDVKRAIEEVVSEHFCSVYYENGGKHVHVIVARPDGKQRFFPVSRGTSGNGDQRLIENVRRDVKRVLRDLGVKS